MNIEVNNLVDLLRHPTKRAAVLLPDKAVAETVADAVVTAEQKLSAAV